MTVQDQTTLQDAADNFKSAKKSHDQALADNQRDLVDTVTVLRRVDFTAAAESSDNIDLTIDVVELDGSTADGADAPYRLRAEIIDETDGLIAANTGFKFTAVSTGTAVAPSGTGQAAQVFDTDSSGQAVLRVNDAGGGSDQDVYVVVEAVGEDGIVGGGITLTFDAS